MTAPARTWSEYLAGQSLEGFFAFCAMHGPMLERALAAGPRRALEMGCGGGNLALALALFDVQCVAIDIEEAVVAEARRHAAAFPRPVEFRVGDATATGEPDGVFDVALSQGVLEHFDDALIEQFIAEGVRVARRSLHSMPNVAYPRRDFGNERLMPAGFWRERAEAAVERSGRPCTVEVLDYRRGFTLRHPLNSLLNRLLDRRFFTLVQVDWA